MVLGIQPRWAETGYGYIEFPKSVAPGALEPCAVRSFREKPDEKTAKKFVNAGNFFWNAGMFFWKTSTVLESDETVPTEDGHAAGQFATVSEPQIREANWPKSIRFATTSLSIMR